MTESKARDIIRNESILWIKLDQGTITSRSIFPSGPDMGNFRGTAASGHSPKVYAIVNQNGICFIGKTRLPLSLRFWFGLDKKKSGRLRTNAKPRKPDERWKTMREAVMCVWELTDGVAKDDFALERIESEMVYRIRQYTGNWPLFQQEIRLSSEEMPRIEQNFVRLALRSMNTVERMLKKYPSPWSSEKSKSRSKTSPGRKKSR
jgi:hypothetical protein